jgi:predicted metal-dependent peptidase
MLTRPPTTDEHQAIAVARYLLVDTKPYYAQLLFSMTPLIVADTPDPVATIDGKLRLYLSAHIVDQPPVELARAMEHLVNHVLRGHERRLGDLPKPPVAGMCGCVEINDDLGGHPHPDDLNLPVGQVAEWYYNRIEDQFEEVEMTCGSGSGADPDDWELGDSATGGEANGQPDLTDLEVDAMRHAAAEQIQAWAKARGDVPAGILRWANETLGPAKVPWEKTLAAYVRAGLASTGGRQDYSFRRPSRRSGEIVRPSLVKPIPKIGVVIDTSGSMAQDDLSAAMTELQAIIVNVGADVRVVSCDADIHGGVQIARSVGDIELRGGGGTDMVAGIAAVMSVEGWTPAVIVVLTDGYTPWPAASMVPTVACLIGWEGGELPPPHIATVICERGNL